MATIRKFFKYSWQHNDSSVYIADTTPRIFEKEVSIKPTIIIDLKDDQFNIDSNTIELYLGGFDITSATTISAITNGYRIVYVSTMDFANGQVISILVKAANSHGIYMPDYSYYFVTKRKRLHELVEETISEIADEIDWDDVRDDRF